MASAPPQAPGANFDVTIPKHPAMAYQSDPTKLDQKLSQPYIPRANLAVSTESPDGTTAKGWARKHQAMSTLEQHVLFFNPSLDGVIWPLDTWRGFHRLGYNAFWCLISVLIIHSGFSYFTGNSWIPDPLFRIQIPNIHRAKHGSDTGAYDTEGRFVPAKFEAIYAKYDESGKGGLTWMEGLRMIRGNRNIADPIGWLAAFFEWLATYLLIWPKDGIVSKESMRTVYDVSAK
ncbi:peroxygenase, partial [Phenoliferia sp. Uapishka_3]